MNVFLDLFLVILAVVLFMLIVLFLVQYVKWCQKLYLFIFERNNEYRVYKDVLEYIRNGNKLKMLTVKDYCDLTCNHINEYKQFLKDNVYYIIIFPPQTSRYFEFCVYSNDRIVLSSFYNLIIAELIIKAGYSKQEIIDIIKGKNE